MSQRCSEAPSLWPRRYFSSVGGWYRPSLTMVRRLRSVCESKTAKVKLCCVRWAWSNNGESPLHWNPWGAICQLAVMAVEDERFLTHLGVDPIATTRAVAKISGMPKWFRGPAPSPCRSAKCSIRAPRTCGPNGSKPFGH